MQCIHSPSYSNQHFQQTEAYLWFLVYHSFGVEDKISALDITIREKNNSYGTAVELWLFPAVKYTKVVLFKYKSRQCRARLGSVMFVYMIKKFKLIIVCQ